MNKILLMASAAVLLGGCKVSVNIEGVGKVTSDDESINCGWHSFACQADYEDNATVSLQAEPATNYTFVEWQGACSGSGDCSIPANKVQEVTAVFEQATEEPLPISELQFNNLELQTCVGNSFEQGTLNTDAASLTCFGAVSLNQNTRLDGIEQLPNLKQLHLRRDCFIPFLQLRNEITCEGVLTTDFSPLSKTNIEELMIEGGAFIVTSFGHRASIAFTLNALPNIPTLTTLVIDGMSNSHIPDISELENLESLTIKSDISDVDNLIDAGSVQLQALTLDTTENIPCDKIDEVYTSHPGLLINGQPEGFSHQCTSTN